MNKSFNLYPSVRVFRDSVHPILSVFGPTVQFMTTPAESDQSLCVMKCVLPADAMVPVHSHTGIECFLMLSGQQQVLIEADGIFSWTVCSAGDFIEVPSGAKHAFRNLSAEPAVSLVTTTAKLGQFFEDAGRPVSPDQEPVRPTPEALQDFHALAIHHGYWLATSDENAAVGLSLT